MIDVLIADDNQEIAKMLKTTVESLEGFRVVSIGADGASALGLYIKYKPQIVFLDIEMPVMDGIECAKEIIGMNPDCYIVFSTAHESYMKDAFELYAFDYMLKPYKLDRVKSTLVRISKLLGNSVVEESPKIDKLMIKSKEGINFVDKDKIVMVQKEGSQTVIITCDSKYGTNLNMNEIEEKLNKSNFMRTHKSYIANINFIDKITPYGRWTHIIEFTCIKDDALITHAKYLELEEML
ncbi:MAG: response regulator transcription factor [Clostridia bacterium]|nr:response regulator transcription factor [Clostridia bacterium]